MSHRTLLGSLLAIFIASAILVGCRAKSVTTPVAGTADTAAALPAGTILAVVPKGAKPLPEVKKSAKKGDTVSFTARIGGQDPAFVAGRAIMVVIDPALPSCSDMGDEDHCKKPWDYCCETPEDRVAAMATVQFVGEDGKPLAVALEGMSGLDPLATVTVVGVVAEKDDSGVFIVNATGVHVAKKG